MPDHETLTAAAHNTRLVGFHDLQGRESLQVTLQGDWCYVGHLPGCLPNPLTGRDEHSGTSILDVSDPAKPTLVCAHPRRAGSQLPRRAGDRESARRQALSRPQPRDRRRMQLPGLRHHGSREAEDGRRRERDAGGPDEHRAQGLVGRRERALLRLRQRARLSSRRPSRDLGFFQSGEAEVRRQSLAARTAAVRAHQPERRGSTCTTRWWTWRTTASICRTRAAATSRCSTSRTSRSPSSSSITPSSPNSRARTPRCRFSASRRRTSRPASATCATTSSCATKRATPSIRGSKCAAWSTCST